MSKRQSRHPTAGGKGPQAVIRRGGPRQPLPVVQLPSEVLCDSVGALRAMLEAGITPEQIWPACSSGFEALLQSTPKQKDPSQIDQPLPRAWGDNYPSEMRRLQEIFRRQRSGDLTAPRTAIRAHKDLAGLISQAQEVICTFGWFHDPAAAIFVCADQSEATEIEALLRSDYHLKRGEDLLESAQWVAEGLMAPCPGWRYSGPPPVLLADQIPPGARWREVFLSPGCRGLQADQLLSAVRAALVGVHVVASNPPDRRGQHVRPRTTVLRHT
jgi:hypothetical protein